MTESTKEITPPVVQEQKEAKSIFFFQCKENFFREENTQRVQECAEENGDNPNDYYVFWIKLLLDSFEHAGCIWRDNYEFLNSAFFRRHLDFRTDKSVKETNELIDRIITAFEKKGLISLLDEARSLFIPCVKSLTMSKKEESEKKREYRQRQARLQRRYENSHFNNFQINEDDDFDSYFDKTFSGLCYLGYALSSEKSKYCEMLHILYDDFKEQNIILATEDFIKSKVERAYFGEIVDRLNYMKATIVAFIKDRQSTYAATKIIREKNNLNPERFKELQRIATSVDWVNDKND